MWPPNLPSDQTTPSIVLHPQVWATYYITLSYSAVLGTNVLPAINRLKPWG